MSTTKIITVSTLIIATLSFVLAIGPVVTSQAALAANLCGSGFCEIHRGTSYPSPLSNSLIIMVTGIMVTGIMVAGIMVMVIGTATLITPIR